LPHLPGGKRTGGTPRVFKNGGGSKILTHLPKKILEKKDEGVLAVSVGDLNRRGAAHPSNEGTTLFLVSGARKKPREKMLKPGVGTKTGKRATAGGGKGQDRLPLA